MANEITITASISAFKPAVMSAAIGRSLQNSLISMAANYYIGPALLLVGTTATAIPLGNVSQPHWAFFANKDLANFITIRNGAAGADLLQMFAGDFAICPLLTTSTPYALANTAACLMEYLILSL